MWSGQHILNHLIIIRLVTLREIQLLNLAKFFRRHTKIKKTVGKILIALNGMVVELRGLITVESMGYKVEEDGHAYNMGPDVDGLIV